MADLTQGNGTHQGYYTMTKNGETTVAKWHGTVQTTLGPDQRPNTTFSGTWEYVLGTGQYQGIKGSGTYHGHFVAKDQYVVEWSGSYTK